MVCIATLSHYIEGIDFPATKQEILDYAEGRGAPPDVIDALATMPEPQYGWYYSITSIWDALSEIG